MRCGWIRVTRQRPCKICSKGDWCTFSADGGVACCMRIESGKPTKNGGWLHRLRDDYIPPRRRTVQRKPSKPKLDCNPIHQRCVDFMRPESLGWLSNDLGISVEAIERFEVGYHPDRNVYSMPMRRPDGSICGIKYRPRNGGKFCETRSRSGMFFVPGSLIRGFVVIVEGCSDAMAIDDLGFRSVIGRDNCIGNVKQITTLLRRLKPHQVVIVPDNDHHGAGLRGAVALRLVLNISHNVTILELPDGINDIRDCVQTQKNADWLANRIRESVSSLESSKGSND